MLYDGISNQETKKQERSSSPLCLLVKVTSSDSLGTSATILYKTAGASYYRDITGADILTQAAAVNFFYRSPFSKLGYVPVDYNIQLVNCKNGYAVSLTELRKVTDTTIDSISFAGADGIRDFFTKLLDTITREDINCKLFFSLCSNSPIPVENKSDIDIVIAYLYQYI